MMNGRTRTVAQCLLAGVVCLAAAAFTQTPASAAKAKGSAAPAASAPTTSAAPAAATAPTPPTTPTLTAEQASYEFGMTFGEQLRHAGLQQDLSLDAVMRGVKDAIGGKKLSAADQQQLAQYVRAVREAQGLRNKAAAKEFLANNARQSGVKTTASGLQYKVIAAGDTKAASPKPDDQVTVNYRGKLLDGSEFDSSFAHGSPATFPANRVIKGWQEALVLMKPGSKYQLFVPPELGYDMDARPGIPPGSLLVFDVDLLSVQPAGPAPAAEPGQIKTN
ncbi:MAG: FKBP-type peptidyl-prolyl cis-trans isomerase [Proteobacteria bacterium]|nr:FKBP-type peptidyl-prolyl cis-trans isomerase [Pseudomonadota bacterium]